MIGLIAGIGLLFSYLGAAWTVDTSEGSLLSSGLGGVFVIFAVFTAVGIVLFPRTIGTALTTMSFATPIAFIIALIRQGLGYSMFILVIGVSAWLVTFIVGKFRPDAT